jgi:1-acyl-sn-glycerol-3-phosphate acyltransferase
MLLLRSLVFQFYFFLSVAIASLTIFFLWPFPYGVRWAVARAWGKSMLVVGRAVCGLDYVVEGLDNIPSEPSVILIKHTTVFETYAQLAIFPPQTWVVKRELQWIPIFGWGLAAMRPIAINRGAGRAAVTQVRQTKKYGVSCAALARDVQCPIVPVAHNAGDLWPRRGLRKKPGLIRFCIGPAIDPADRPPRETNLLVQDWIESRMREISPSYTDAAS